MQTTGGNRKKETKIDLESSKNWKSRHSARWRRRRRREQPRETSQSVEVESLSDGCGRVDDRRRRRRSNCPRNGRLDESGGWRHSHELLPLRHACDGSHPRRRYGCRGCGYVGHRLLPRRHKSRNHGWKRLENKFERFMKWKKRRRRRRRQNIPGG